MKSILWKMLILINRRALLFQTCYEERSNFPAEVQGMLTYQQQIYT
ncbi:hypothetical protein GLYMA_20G066751v4 [Glycine max]|nr:hypothetical protein GLYMA_20G066751v4 [Glycine max]KAH1034888.1 hypothetical protein GYH30_055037 [Glycine max]